MNHHFDHPIRLLIVLSELLHYRIPLMNALARCDGLEVTVLHSGKPTCGPDTQYKELVIRCQSFAGLKFQSDLLRVVDRYDVVIANFNVRWISNLLLLAKRRRYKLIWWGIGFGRYRIMAYLRVVLARLGDALIVYTSSAQNEFVNRGIPAEKIFVAHNTVDVANPFLNNNTEERKKFLFIGSLHQRKRIEQLIRAFGVIEQQIPPDITVDVIGSGPQETKLHALVSELGLERRIKFHGRLEDSDILRGYFSSALAVVSPGQAGLAVLHSFAHGVPFITMSGAISGGEIDNIEDGVNGFLYDGTIQDLSRKLLLLANSPKLSLELGENAYRHYTQHRTLSKMTDSFIQAIKFVINDNY